MPTRRRLIGAGAASIALAGVSASSLKALAQEATPPATSNDDEQDNATPVVGSPILRPTIDLIRAQELALEGNNGAVVTKIELHGEDGVLVYTVALDNGVKVDVDATTGTVIKTEQTNGDGDDDDGDGQQDEGEQEDDDADVGNNDDGEEDDDNDDQ